MPVKDPGIFWIQPVHWGASLSECCSLAFHARQTKLSVLLLYNSLPISAPKAPLCYSSYKGTNPWENSWNLLWLLEKAGGLHLATQAHRIEAWRDLGRTQSKFLLKARPPLRPDAAKGFIHSAPENLQGCKTPPALQFVVIHNIHFLASPGSLIQMLLMVSHSTALPHHSAFHWHTLNSLEQERKAQRSQKSWQHNSLPVPQHYDWPDTSSQLTHNVSASGSNQALPTLASTQFKSVIISCQLFHCSSTGGPQSYSPTAAHDRSCLILYFLQ